MKDMLVYFSQIYFKCLLLFIWYLAPPGCLQYFTGPVGVLRSFNFFFDAGSASSARQLSYQDYTICIRQENVFHFWLLKPNFLNLIVKNLLKTEFLRGPVQCVSGYGQ